MQLGHNSLSMATALHLKMIISIALNPGSHVEATISIAYFRTSTQFRDRRMHLRVNCAWGMWSIELLLSPPPPQLKLLVYTQMGRPKFTLCKFTLCKKKGTSVMLRWVHFVAMADFVWLKSRLYALLHCRSLIANTSTGSGEGGIKCVM